MAEPLRVAILNNLETIPWLPLVAGLSEGFRELGADVRCVRVSELPEFFLDELDAFGPDLALLPFCKWEWNRCRPYLGQLKAKGVTTAAVLWDDPYDMETGLALAEECDAVFTPEELAVDFYAKSRPARHLAPVVSTTLHYPPSQPFDQVVDVAMVGGVFWKPRRGLLPLIREFCARSGRNYTEVAGVRRWIAGHALTNFLHRSRVVLEIPRYDLPTRSNPHQVPCTYTGPRVYIAERCQTFVMAIGPRPDFADRFPFYATCDHDPDAIVETLRALLDRGALQPEDPHPDGLPILARRQHDYDPTTPGWHALTMLDFLHRSDVFAGRALERSSALLSDPGRPGDRDSKSPPGASTEAAQASQP